MQIARLETQISSKFKYNNGCSYLHFCLLVFIINEFPPLIEPVKLQLPSIGSMLLQESTLRPFVLDILVPGHWIVLLFRWYPLDPLWVVLRWLLGSLWSPLLHLTLHLYWLLLLLLRRVIDCDCTLQIGAIAGLWSLTAYVFNSLLRLRIAHPVGCCAWSTEVVVALWHHCLMVHLVHLLKEDLLTVGVPDDMAWRRWWYPVCLNTCRWVVPILRGLPLGVWVVAHLRGTSASTPKFFD